MTHFEYKVVPAPSRGEKARGVRSAEARFALALERAMNEMGRDGWEYVRAETLPSEERQGLTSTVTTYRNVLVFRRERVEGLAAYKPRLITKSDAPLPIAQAPQSAAPRRLEPQEAAAPKAPAVPSILRMRAERLRTGKDDVAAE